MLDEQHISISVFSESGHSIWSKTNNNINLLIKASPLTSIEILLSLQVFNALCAHRLILYIKLNKKAMSFLKIVDTLYILWYNIKNITICSVGLRIKGCL